MHIRSLSLRTKFLLIVLVGAVGPLALIGTWVARSTVRSGEQLLRTRLDASLASVSATNAASGTSCHRRRFPHCRSLSLACSCLILPGLCGQRWQRPRVARRCR